MALALLVLCAGMPLLDLALGSGRRQLAPGTIVSVGTESDGVRPVAVTVTHNGWVLNKGNSSLSGYAQLHSADVVFNLSVVIPLVPFDARELWDGLARIVAIGGRTRLGTRPRPITTAHGLSGLIGTLTGRGRTGTAAVYATDTLGATVTAAGPPVAFQNVAAQVEAMVRTVTISGPGTSQTSEGRP
ncbi:hypothetical protein GCM10022254_52250 [Actinomadura meridiana]|uniref:Uncharacterized protein n=1 Tax=Actinomadura meridiana TaxID=559626 RepID=A0ABP8CDP3_9ACTN